MAIEETPLGFQLPDNDELFRDGNEVIAANGAKDEELHQDARGRLGDIETKNATQDAEITTARTGAVADAKTYTDGQVATDRGRLADIETVNTTQDGRLTSVEAVTPKLTKTGETWAAILAEDKAGQVAIGVKPDGTTYVSNPDVLTIPTLTTTTNSNATRLTSVEAAAPQLKATDDTWAAVLAEDNSGHVALGIRPNGTVAGGGLPEITGYDIIVLGGQSDMSGSAKPFGTDVFPPHPRVLQYPATRWAESGQIMPAIEPLLGQGPLTSAKGGGPGLMFGRLWAEAHPDRIVLLVPAAASATGFNTSAKTTPDPGMAFSVGCWQINKLDEPVNLGQGLVDQAVAAKSAATLAAGVGKTANVVAFLWSQGLSDGALTTVQYSTYFDELAGALRTALAQPDLPIVVGQMSPQGIAGSISAWKIDQAHMDTPRRLTRAAFAYSFGNLTNSATDDHLSPRGQHKYAEAMFAAHERASLNIADYAPIGVENLTAKKVGAVVRVRWTAPASRVTGYTIDYSADGGAYVGTGVTQYYDMDTAAELPWTGATMTVRVTANNEFGVSAAVTTDL